MPGHEQQPNIAYNRTRVLLGWLSEEEGIAALNGTRPSPEEATQLREQVRAARAAVVARPPFQQRQALVDESTSAELLAETATRPSIRAVFAGMVWRTAIADLRAVLSFQKMVN